MAGGQSRVWFLTIHKEERWSKFIEYCKENVDKINYVFVSGGMAAGHLFKDFRKIWPT